jgi:hypothetical protein
MCGEMNSSSFSQENGQTIHSTQGRLAKTSRCLELVAFEVSVSGGKVSLQTGVFRRARLRRSSALALILRFAQDDINGRNASANAGRLGGVEESRLWERIVR